MKKILVICGPTATGKTSLAIDLAEKFSGEIVSADSRQVYKGMDVGTGKDIPKDAAWHLSELSISDNQFPIGYWEIPNSCRIWGYDLVNPEDNFNVTQYSQIATKVINYIWNENKLPIIVGGTGYYIKALFDGIETSNIVPDPHLRKELEKKDANELFELLSKNDNEKATKMNASDKRNKRRLIRAIEVSNSQETGEDVIKLPDSDYFIIGLTASLAEIEKRIKMRVKERLGAGFEHEVKNLIETGVSWESQSMSIAAYRVWKSYWDGEITKERAENKWIIKERQYAKRQKTWFAKDERINWFDVTNGEYPKNVEKLVQRWHNKK